jgi:hypothetical protein
MIASLSATPSRYARLGEGMATMSYGDHPGGEQEYDTGRAFGAPPSHLDQPGYGQPGSMPPTYRAWGIVALICGALLNLILGVPTAIVGLRSGAEVPRLWASGDVQAAVRASRRARSWLIASGVLDLLGIILTIAIYIHRSGNGTG